MTDTETEIREISKKLDLLMQVVNNNQIENNKRFEQLEAKMDAKIAQAKKEIIEVVDGKIAQAKEEIIEVVDGKIAQAKEEIIVVIDGKIAQAKKEIIEVVDGKIAQAKEEIIVVIDEKIEKATKDVSEELQYICEITERLDKRDDRKLRSDIINGIKQFEKAVS